MATVINVKYIENVQQECAEPMLSNATPIEKEMLVNINCSIGIIIDYIREIAQLDEKVEFDLCDEITYQLKNVYSFRPYVSGLMILRPNLTYLIVILQRDSSGQILNAVPIVPERSTKSINDIVAKIRKQTKRQSGASVSKIIIV
ncbi:uncharacterized protein LOC107274218 isoform X2 [Cephus cinctus]|uniref:Uncharacterized protein LOC107274218 isoform X2 n=1 Tax=Cephus cinctus TaxID=211228 RepID=A0AAJ7W6Q2_CEPCN|nr:uncharacterized protein LOC107274218 isoform X2 [Cephus cinctus]XP_015609039.1 uncharacterized protein LOC107274218 isoform X2 [Cephus cinctus]XP_024946431.1 uncharacterized protein LOC107274218 isoform X2 [Cephus cinctus]